MIGCSHVFFFRLRAFIDGPSYRKGRRAWFTGDAVQRHTLIDLSTELPMGRAVLGCYRRDPGGNSEATHPLGQSGTETAMPLISLKGLGSEGGWGVGRDS